MILKRLVLPLAMMTAALPARAEIITWTITGTVNYVSDYTYTPESGGTYNNGGLLATNGITVNIGDTFTAQYTFDTSVAPTYQYAYNDSNPPPYAYTRSNANTQWNNPNGESIGGSFSANVGGYAFAGASSNAYLNRDSYSYDNSAYYPGDLGGWTRDQVSAYSEYNNHDYPQTQCQWTGSNYNCYATPYQYSYAYGTAPGTTIVPLPGADDHNHGVWAGGYISLYDNQDVYGTASTLQNILTDLSQFPTSIDFSQFNNAYVGTYGGLRTNLNCNYLRYDGGNDCRWASEQWFEIQANITSITSSVQTVPAPGALALLGLGLIGLGAVRRKQRNA